MALDLDAYLARIAYRGDLTPGANTLANLHLAHATSIPFENLDVLLGRPVRLDLDSLQAKLVAARRGGYCFEQNLLFAAVLEHLGFHVTRLAARVRYRTTSLLPRTHLLLHVTTDGEEWVADVGFGGEGLLLPVPLGGSECRQFGWTYRITEEGGQRVLQSREGEGWHDLYAFTLEPHHLVDFEMANYYVSTHPSSIFVRMLTVQRPGTDVRRTLRNRELTLETASRRQTRTVGDDEVLGVLAAEFGLALPEETRLPLPA